MERRWITGYIPFSRNDERYMKHLANKEIFSILKDLKIENFSINRDGSVDVDGWVDISYRGLTKIPVQFGHVTGDFYCNNNYLTTLDGAPKRVDGGFYCDINKLTSLEGSPKEVGESFYCNNNQLTSLVGAPSEVDGNFYFRNNPLPNEILNNNIDDIKYIVEYQELYSIWRQDGSLDLFRFKEMMKDRDI